MWRAFKIFEIKYKSGTESDLGDKEILILSCFVSALMAAFTNCLPYRFLARDGKWQLGIWTFSRHDMRQRSLFSLRLCWNSVFFIGATWKLTHVVQQVVMFTSRACHSWSKNTMKPILFKYTYRTKTLVLQVNNKSGCWTRGKTNLFPQTHIFPPQYSSVK